MGSVERAECVELLGRAALFSGLDLANLERLAATGSQESFGRGERIFLQGDRGAKFYMVLRGAVRISRTVPGMGEEALAVMRPGDSFGEMSLIEDAPRSADALAHEAAVLFVLTKEQLEDLLFVNRDLAYEFLWKLARLLSTRLRETTDKVTFLSAASKFE